MIKNSLEYCGILNQSNLHNALRQIIQTNTFQADHIDDFIATENFDGFEVNDDKFENNEQDDAGYDNTDDNFVFADNIDVNLGINNVGVNNVVGNVDENNTISEDLISNFKF